VALLDVPAKIPPAGTPCGMVPVLGPTVPVASANCCACSSIVALRDTGLLEVPCLLLVLVLGLLPSGLAGAAAGPVAYVVLLLVLVLAGPACFSTVQ
jgi:hypothetical protein